MQLRWHLDGWADYVDWQTNDKKVLRKINLDISPGRGAPVSAV